MTREDAFNQLYDLEGYPKEMKKELYPIFENLYANISRRMEEEHKDIYVLEPDVVLSYLYEEHLFNIRLLSSDQIRNLFENTNYAERLTAILTDKIYINEFKSYENQPLIKEHNPLVTTYEFFLNFIMNRFDEISKLKNPRNPIFLDILKKGLEMSKGVIYLLNHCFETEAFATWRTIHEVECIAKVLYDMPYLEKIYARHIEYARFYHSDNGDKDRQEALHREVREKMQPFGLKSKDTKKYIEYGWLYGIENYSEIYPEMKLNFRKGVELVAGLSRYSSAYETSSELAHSSPLLIYSNRDYFKSMAILHLYGTFFRMEIMLNDYLTKEDRIDSSAYFSMRKDYLAEMTKNISIERIAFQMKYSR